MERWLLLLFRGAYVIWAGPLLVQWLGTTDPGFALPKWPMVAQLVLATGASLCVIAIGFFRPTFLRKAVFVNDGAVFLLFVVLFLWEVLEAGYWVYAHAPSGTGEFSAAAVVTGSLQGTAFLLFPSWPLLAEGGIAWALWKGMPLLLRRYR